MRKKQLAATAPDRLFPRDGGLELAPCLQGPERLVALGFRYWTLGCSQGEVACWERAWTLYAGQFGVAGARVAVAHLSQWVTRLDRASSRKIQVCPEACRSFCRDECIAVEMIAACQQHACPGMRACAFALVDSTILDDVLDGAQAFADTLLSLDQVLSPGPIVTAVASVKLPSMTVH